MSATAIPVPGMGFIKAIAEPPSAIRRIYPQMDFPTLDEMECDIPVLHKHMRMDAISRDDEENVDMQCLLNVRPNLGGPLVHW